MNCLRVGDILRVGFGGGAIMVELGGYNSTYCT